MPDAVDERGAEVVLGHHEHRRDQPEHEDPRRRLAPHQPHPAHQEARQRDDEQHLAELGRLEAEEPDLDPGARRRASRSRRASTNSSERDQQPVDGVAQLLQPRVVDPRERVHQHHADAGEDRLAVDVVVRARPSTSARVAPFSAISEQATSPSAARSSSGSMRSRHSRGASEGGRSEAGLIGVAVLTRRAERSGWTGGSPGRRRVPSSAVARSHVELVVLDAEPLLQDLRARRARRPRRRSRPSRSSRRRRSA